jgi:hypothetical protein
MNLSHLLHRRAADLFVGALLFGGLSACGGGGGYYSGGGGGPPPTATSYVGTTGVFVAWADPNSGAYVYSTVGTYAGKKQVQHGSVDFMTGQSVGQAAAVQIYKANDGHVYAVDLATSGNPTPQQISTESAATVDDLCSFTGTAAAGANYDYAGIYFAADLQSTTNSSYFYRLPGPDGVCNTPDDVIHMVKTGMATTDAPIVASAMPVATVHTSQGGISGFVIKSGANLVLVDSNFANPVVLGTFAAPIGVAAALPVGTVQGYPTGQLYVVDGNIVYVDYVADTTSAPLFTIPNWSPTNTQALFAASPDTLYFSINTPATQTVAASAGIYSLAADGSGAPALVESTAGRIDGLQFPVQSANLIFSVLSPNFSVQALPVSGGPTLMLASDSDNAGSFTATAANVYFTTWEGSTDAATHTVTRSGTQSGIVGVNGTLIQALLANSMFMSGGEEFPWPNDTTTTQTAYETMFQITGLAPVTVTNPTSGEVYIEDGVSGGDLIAIDAGSNQIVANIGTLPAGTATFLSGTFRGYEHTGFIEATTAISTQDPATRDLYLINSQGTGSLERVTDNL